jgi:hypothetical protein|tara:strand:- start:499 stop:924 length:426 start_codon:yes stop_codon:yes gene_type:complete
MDRIKGINSKHRILVREHLKFLQSRLYDLTEYDKTNGKFLDFVDVLDTIVKYSNDFKDYTNKNRGKDEWMYMIPTLSLYASLGFMVGIKNEEIQKRIDMSDMQEEIIAETLELVAELADVLTDYREKKGIEKELNKIKQGC